MWAVLPRRLIVEGRTGLLHCNGAGRRLGKDERTNVTEAATAPGDDHCARTGSAPVANTSRSAHSPSRPPVHCRRTAGLAASPIRGSSAALVGSMSKQLSRVSGARWHRGRPGSTIVGGLEE